MLNSGMSPHEDVDKFGEDNDDSMESFCMMQYLQGQNRVVHIEVRIARTDARVDPAGSASWYARNQKMTLGCGASGYSARSTRLI